MNYSAHTSASKLGTSLPPLSLNDAALLPPSSLLKKPKGGPSACDACRKRKVRCDKQQPCSTCTVRGLPCKYELVEAAAAAASMPTSLRFPNSSAGQIDFSSRPRGSVNTALYEPPFAQQGTSDSVSAARFASRASGLDLPPLPPLPSLRASGYSSTSALGSNLGSVPPGNYAYNYSSLNPTIQPNLRSGSWSQVESALPPLNGSIDSHQQPLPSFSRYPSYEGHTTALSSTHPMGSFGELDLPPLAPLSRPSSPSRVLKRSSSTNSLSSLSDWNSISKTPSLSLDGSRRSASSDSDDQFSMPSTAGSFGLQTPLQSTGSRSAFSKSEKPMFGYEASSSHASPYGMHAPIRTASTDPLQGLHAPSHMGSNNSFRILSSETYPSLTPYTPTYSSGNGALGSNGLLSGNSSTLGMNGSTSQIGGYPDLPGGRDRLPPAPFDNVHGRSSLSTFPQSPASRDPLVRSQNRQLSRNASYAGLRSFEASGW